MNILLLLFSVLLSLCLFIFGIKKKILIIVLLLLIGFLFNFIIKKKVKITNKYSKYYPFVIFVMTLLFRLIVIFIFGNKITQVSDFGTAYNNLFDFNINTLGYTAFTHWVYYILLFKRITDIIGINPYIIYIIDAIIISISNVLIYNISNHIFKNKNISLLSSTIYCFIPINIFYTSVFTQEHINILLILCYLLLFIKLFEQDKFNYKYVIYPILIGVLLGISIFFKNFSSIFIIAFLISIILISLKNKSIKKLLYLSISFVILFLSYLCTKNLMYNYLDNNYFNHEVVRNITPCYLNVGLNSKGDGYYNEKLYNEYFNTLKEENYNYKITNEIIMTNLKKDIKSNYKSLPKKFASKMNTLLNGDYGKASFLAESFKDKSKRLYDATNNYLIKIDNIYYYLIVAFMLFGIIKIYQDKNINMYFLLIGFFGSLLSIILIETQNRYKYCLEPIMVMCTAYGVEYYYLLVRSLYEKRIKKLYKNR